MQKKWLRKKTTNQLIMRREMAMMDIATAKERSRDMLGFDSLAYFAEMRLVKMMEATLKEVESILKERRENV